MKKLLFFWTLFILLVSCNKEDGQLSVNNSSLKERRLQCYPDDAFWQLATPASQQMNQNIIYALGARIQSFSNVKSFLIIRNGKIVHEQYLNGATQDSLLNTASITKRVTASLIGIAIDRRIISSVNKPINSYFPEITFMNADPKWNQVTIYHLLNMVSGMDWVEVKDIPAFEYTFYNPNPLPMTFSRSIVHEPGTIFSYNSPGVHLLSYIIERSSRRSVSHFASRNLFHPLRISEFKWQADGNNVENGSANLYLKSRDLAKIGLLYLQDGVVKNRRILSKKWIDASLRTPINLDTLQGSYLATGPDLVSKPGMSVGNTWWTMNYMGETIHYADGYGGQI